MIDPFQYGEKIKELVNRGLQRKYYRFRDTRFYGGSATADCVGCNLNCVYCWAKKPREKPENIGKFYSPEKVTERLLHIALKNHRKHVRISGTEPTLNKEHLGKVLRGIRSHMKSDLTFILETNGLELGNDKDFVSQLAEFKNFLHVRVSLKGADGEMFSKLTKAKPEFFQYQLKALEFCAREGISCNAAIMADFYPEQNLNQLQEKLKSIDENLLSNLEYEALKLYPHVKKNLESEGIL